MKFRSTRGAAAVTLDQALLEGIAADGGLFVPETLPRFQLEDFAACETIAEVAELLLRPFFAGSALANELHAIVRETYSFPIPCKPFTTATQKAWLLELFHGPTAAFKDVGARFLAACLSRLNPTSGTPLTILVATSGDTGGAVAAAFDGRPGIQVVVLFPNGRVSARQQQQLTCWGDNVLSLSVDGAFDDCQALVKAAFVDDELCQRYRFSSANSINIGRLLPQSIYYAFTSLEHFRVTGRRPGFVVPTGNLGNGLACVMARDMGFPLGDIVLAVNENKLIANYLRDGNWLPADSVETLASAMDVGNPSNMERLRAMHGEADQLRRMLRAFAVTNDEIETEIQASNEEFGAAVCPHTATAIHVWRRLPPHERTAKDWILVSTAHAAKFDSVVEPLIGQQVPLPPELARILDRPSHETRIGPTLDALSRAMDHGLNS
ncbi:MAG: threonine synthase [Woeseia sp.]|nr:threonine synthase [Woeseia sp.]